MKSADEMYKFIIDKSTTDPAFRKQLLAEPKDTITKELGITLPESMDIHVHESDMQTVHVSLPPDPNFTEEQLEGVAAGLCCGVY
ncbi:MAG: NHLP leader peptide family RiPP precursor [Paracoccaceae bacterium]|nr:NHLP leader peptide family RiPP precursor [Paracoccaceae bacterium]MDE2917730.1 NHLP leader peptide family RiPP precursor [Paracoccaceae bacterium]